MPRAPDSRRPVSNPLGLAILALLFEKPMHPYEMASTMRFRHKHESIRLNYGSLYTVIGALVRASLIEGSEKVREGARPERTVYTIAAGEGELFDWLRDLIRKPVKEYPQFEAALSLLPVLPPDEAKKLLEQRAGLLDEEIASRKRMSADASRQGIAPIFLIEDEYQTAMCEAERKWVLSLVRMMEATPEFTRDWRAWHRARKPRRARKPADPKS